MTETYEERDARQRDRALLVAQQLTGRRHPGRNIVASILALVVAVERDADPYGGSPGPAGGARQVLVKRRRKSAK